MQDQTLFLVYETDEWHSNHSNRLCGIFTTREAAIEAIAEHHKIPHTEFRCYFDDEEMADCIPDEFIANEVKSILRDELETNNQTQGFSTNYTIESCTVNDPWF